MDVAPAHGDVMKWSDIVMDRDCNSANHEDGSKETYRSEKKPFAARLRKLPLVDRAQTSSRNDKREQPEDSRHNEWPNPKASVRPRHSNVTLVQARLTDRVDKPLGAVRLSFSRDTEPMLANRF